jgi:serine protease Do
VIQDVHLRYRNGCMMLFHREAQELAFVGTAFLVHPKGYLLTAAHILYAEEGLMVSPEEAMEEFGQTGRETVGSIPVKLAGIDRERDVALLKFEEELEITVPDHLLGVPEEATVGASVASLGYPFGFHHVYDQVLQQGIISAKIDSQNGTELLLFDSQVHSGARGAPLISVDDLRVIGIVSGRFDPAEASPDWHRSSSERATNFSYAISIRYADPLLEAAGLETD